MAPPRVPAPPDPPAAALPPPPRHLPPSPFVPVRLAAQAPELPPPPPRIRSIVVDPSARHDAVASRGASHPTAAPPARVGEDGWQAPRSRRRPRRDVLPSQRVGSVARPLPRGSQRDAAALRFLRRTRGRCARCLASLKHHASAACRDPVRCLSYNLSGHRERDCPLRLASKLARPLPTQPSHCRPSSTPLAPGAASWASVAAPTVQGSPSASSVQAAPVPPLSTSAMCGSGSTANKIVDVAISASELRSFLAELAASLRAEIEVCLAAAVTPLLAELVMLRGRIERSSVSILPSETCSASPVGQGEDVHHGDVESHELEPLPPDVAEEVRPCIASISVQQDEERLQEMMSRVGACHGDALAMPAAVADVVFFDSGMDVLDADTEEAALGSPLATDAGDDDADLLASSDTALRGVAALFGPPAVPLLPTPLLLSPRAPVDTPAPYCRSSRLAMKPLLPSVDKAVRVLHKKMGLDVDDMPLVQATKEFQNSLKTPLSGSALDALSTLFKLNLPSMTAVDEALIALGGAGGSDFPPPVALDVSV